MVREDFLQQDAYHEIDTFCPLQKQYHMLKILMEFYSQASDSIEAGMSVGDVINLPVVEDISRMKYKSNDDFDKHYEQLSSSIKKCFKENQKKNIKTENNEEITDNKKVETIEIQSDETEESEK